MLRASSTVEKPNYLREYCAILSMLMAAVLFCFGQTTIHPNYAKWIWFRTISSRLTYQTMWYYRGQCLNTRIVICVWVSPRRRKTKRRFEYDWAYILRATVSISIRINHHLCPWNDWPNYFQLILAFPIKHHDVTSEQWWIERLISIAWRAWS